MIALFFIQVLYLTVPLASRIFKRLTGLASNYDNGGAADGARVMERAFVSGFIIFQSGVLFEAAPTSRQMPVKGRGRNIHSLRNLIDRDLRIAQHGTSRCQIVSGQGRELLVVVRQVAANQDSQLLSAWIET